jgi:hypothetical protein
VGLLLKEKLGLTDPLLKSLEKDNTFVRMLAYWRRAEDEKAARFRCRPVNLYVAVEGSILPYMSVVPPESAAKPYERLAKKIEYFNNYNHFRIAAPDRESDPLFKWVANILREEQERIDHWGKKPLCERNW